MQGNCLCKCPNERFTKTGLAREIEVHAQARQEVANGIAGICHVIQDNGGGVTT